MEQSSDDGARLPAQTPSNEYRQARGRGKGERTTYQPCPSENTVRKDGYPPTHLSIVNVVVA